MPTRQYNLIDLFSGAGGMSFGFHRHPGFRVLAAADAELGKPSSGRGRLQCNSTYSTNMGLTPVRLDLSEVSPAHLRSALGLAEQLHISVLAACR